MIRRIAEFQLFFVALIQEVNQDLHQELKSLCVSCLLIVFAFNTPS